MNKSPEFTAENITSLYMQSQGIANTLGLELSATLDGNAATQKLSGVNNETTQEHVLKNRVFMPGGLVPSIKENR